MERWRQRAGAALAALFADGKTPWQRTLFILLVVVAGLAFAILLAAGLQAWVPCGERAVPPKARKFPPGDRRSRSVALGSSKVSSHRSSRFATVSARPWLGLSRSGSLYSPAIADMARPGLRGGRAEMQRDFHSIVAVEFRDDWPKDVRGERAFEEFRLQIHQASRSSEGVELDELLAAEATLLILDDVRTESDLSPFFFSFFDKCTVLVTALDSRISTALKAGSRPFTHFDLTSSKEAVWVSEWARRILTREWKSDSAAGDLVEGCASWPLLAARG